MQQEQEQEVKNERGKLKRPVVVPAESGGDKESEPEETPDVELAEEGVRLVFARLHQNVASSLEMAGVEVESRSYRRIASAVDAVTDHRG